MVQDLNDLQMIAQALHTLLKQVNEQNLPSNWGQQLAGFANQIERKIQILDPNKEVLYSATEATSSLLTAVAKTCVLAERGDLAAVWLTFDALQGVVENLIINLAADARYFSQLN